SHHPGGTGPTSCTGHIGGDATSTTPAKPTNAGMPTPRPQHDHNELQPPYQYWAGTGRWAISLPSVVATVRRVSLVGGGVAVTVVVSALVFSLASAADTGIGHHWQGFGLGDALGAHSCQHGVEQVELVPLEVERQVQRCDQFVLKLPWPVADNPADIGVLC